MRGLLNLFSYFFKIFDSWIGTIFFVLFVIFFVAQGFVIPSGSMQSTMLIGDFLLGKKYVYGIPIPRIPWLEIPILPDFYNNGHLIEGNKPKRGDIVIFRYPFNEQQHYVKRLVATEDDEVIYTQNGLYFRPKEGDKYIAEHYAGDKKRTFMGRIFVYDPYQKRHPGVQYIDSGDAFRDLFELYRIGTPIAMQLYEENGEFFFYHQVEKERFFMMGDNRNASSDSRFWGSIEYRHVVGAPWFVYLSWDEDYIIRWNRIGRSIEAIEENMRQSLVANTSDEALKDASEELTKQQY